MLLLDTHVWVWVVHGDSRRVGRRARALIARNEARDAVYVSTATIFEVAALQTAGRLQLTVALEHWLRDAIDLGGIRTTPLSVGVALNAGAIPRNAVADPLDRLLIATARELDAVFLTADKGLLAYASETRRVKAHDAAL